MTTPQQAEFGTRMMNKNQRVETAQETPQKTVDQWKYLEDNPSY